MKKGHLGEGNLSRMNCMWQNVFFDAVVRCIRRDMNVTDFVTLKITLLWFRVYQCWMPGNWRFCNTTSLKENKVGWLKSNFPLVCLSDTSTNPSGCCKAVAPLFKNSHTGSCFACITKAYCYQCWATFLDTANSVKLRVLPMRNRNQKIRFTKDVLIKSLFLVMAPKRAVCLVWFVY